MRWAFLFCVTLGAGGAALAACPTAVVAKKVVVQEVAVAQVVTPVAAYQTLAVLVPAYAAAYHPAPAPAAPVAPAGPSADTKAILDALKALDGRLQALERTRPASPAAPAPGPMAPAGGDDPFNPAGVRAPVAGKAPAVFSAKCASCHQRGKEDAGGGFVLLEPDGSVAKLDARAVLATARRSYGGTMPPKKSSVAPLTDAEVAEVMAWLDTMK